MSAGERYGLSVHLAEPDPKCRFNICDGFGYYVPTDDVGNEQMEYHHASDPCGNADQGGCRGHRLWLRCLCTAR